MASQTRILDETDNFLLLSEHEEVVVKNKKTEHTFHAGSHYGDPVDGIISTDEKWVVSAGEGLVVSDMLGHQVTAFRNDKPLTWLNDFQALTESDKDWLRSAGSEASLFVHALKLEAPNRIRILLDPWSEYASVWVLEVAPKRLTKLKDGPDLRGQPWRAVSGF